MHSLTASRRFPPFGRSWALLLALGFGLVLAGCRVLDYRQVQRDFQAAVVADNSGQTFGVGHDLVLERLTPEYIARLEPRLRPNAWMLRAISSWRTGEYTNATESAQAGLHALNGLTNHPNFKGSRDHLILTMVPALVADSRNARIGTNALTPATYTPIASAYQTAFGHLDEAAQQISPSTPPDALAYLYYQRWRLLQNWLGVINELAEPLAATQKAERLLHQPFDEAIKEARERIPAGHPLAALIKAQSGE